MLDISTFLFKSSPHLSHSGYFVMVALTNTHRGYKVTNISLLSSAFLSSIASLICVYRWFSLMGCTSHGDGLTSLDSRWSLSASLPHTNYPESPKQRTWLTKLGQMSILVQQGSRESHVPVWKLDLPNVSNAHCICGWGRQATLVILSKSERWKYNSQSQPAHCGWTKLLVSATS